MRVNGNFVKIVLVAVFVLKTSDLVAAPVECADLFELASQIDQLSSDQSSKEELRDLLDFERRVLTFFRDAPPVLYDSIGMSFGLLGSSVETEHGRDLSPKALEIFRREAILKKAAVGILDTDWEGLSEFYADLELYRFLVTALLALPAGSKPWRQQISLEQIQLHALVFQSKYPLKRAFVALMLESSSLLRDTFVRTARRKDKTFKLDLVTKRSQEIAVGGLYDKKFGSLQKFLCSWLVEIYNASVEISEENFGTYQSFNQKSVDDQIESVMLLKNRDDGYYDASVANYIYRWTSSVMSPNASYSADQVREALVQAFKQHHEVLKSLISEERGAESLDFRYVHRFVYEPSGEKADQGFVDKTSLESYIESKLPIDQLQPDQDYQVVFRRDFGLRRKIHFVRFTSRGVAELRRWQAKKFDGLTPEDWLKAIQFGFAAKQGERGIKFLQSSPLPAFRHFEIEVKLLGTGKRWLGYVKDGHYVLDLFYDPHS